MPATSKNQRVAAAIAEHAPDKLYARNRSMLKMNRKQLHAYAATKGLGKKNKKVTHDHAAPGGIAHQGSTVEGPNFTGAKATRTDFTTGKREDEQDFDHAGTTKEGPEWSGAAASGKTAGVTAQQEPKAFANSGTSREGPRLSSAASSQSAPNAGGNVTRPRITRAKTGAEHSGGSPDGFSTNVKAARRDGTGSFGTSTSREQAPITTGDYEGERPGNWTPTGQIKGQQHQQGPKGPVKRDGPHAFSMSNPELKQRARKWKQERAARTQRR